MLLLMYQVFSSLRGHLLFLCAFFLAFYGKPFYDSPYINITMIRNDVKKRKKNPSWSYLIIHEMLPESREMRGTSLKVTIEANQRFAGEPVEASST